MAVPTMQALLAQRAKLETQMRELADSADDATGTLTDAAQAAWNDLEGAMEKLKSAIAMRARMDDAERRGGGVALTGTGDGRLDADISRRYSLARLLRHRAGLGGDAGFETEVSAELARRSGREPEGVFMPLSALAPVERRVTTTALPSTGPGGNVIGTYLDPALFIAPLYAAMRVRQAGATVISGLTSNIDMPQQSQSVVGSWVAENTPLTFTDPGFQRVSLRPKHYGTISEFSRNILQQSTPDIETILRNDMVNVIARGLDAAAIAGTGPASNQPLGVLNQNIAVVPLGTNGGPLTWGAVLELIEAVEVYNVGDDSRAFIGNARVKASAAQTPKVAGVALGFIQDDPNMMAGYKFLSTMLMPSTGTKGSGVNLSSLLYGNFSDLCIGLWSECDILVNPYESVAYSKGNVQVRAMMTCDIAVRHVQSFAAIEDIVAG